MCLSVWIFGFLLFGPLWSSWIWMSVTFLRLVKLLAIITLRVFMHLCFFFFGDPYNVYIGLFDVFHKYCKISLLFILFSFCSSDRMNPTFLSLSSLIFSSSLVCCWTSLLNFSVHLLYCSSLWFLFGTILHFLYLHWNSLCISVLFCEHKSLLLHFPWPFVLVSAH